MEPHVDAASGADGELQAPFLGVLTYGHQTRFRLNIEIAIS